MRAMPVETYLGVFDINWNDPQYNLQYFMQFITLNLIPIMCKKQMQCDTFLIDKMRSIIKCKKLIWFTTLIDTVL